MPDPFVRAFINLIHRQPCQEDTVIVPFLSEET